MIGEELPRAVLFDMDGTLTAPTFDFPAMRRTMGLPEGAAILEHLATLPDSARARAEQILHDYEDEVAATAPLAEGCRQILKCILSRGRQVALITRNRRQSVETFLGRHPLPIEVCISREDGPHKPDPFPLLLACRRLGVEPCDAWMVGDGQFDIEAANRAGIRSIWLSLGRQRPFDATPWLTVENLTELHRLFEQAGEESSLAR